MIFKRQYLVTIELDTVTKVAKSTIGELENDGMDYTIEYVGDGTDLHAIMENNGRVINLETFRESMMHVLKYCSKIIFRRYQDACRDNYYRSRIKEESENAA